MKNDNEQWYAQNRDEANKLLDESDALKKKAQALLDEAKRKESMAMDYKARADKIKTEIMASSERSDSEEIRERQKCADEPDGMFSRFYGDSDE